MSDNTSKLSFVMEMVDRITTPISKVTDHTTKSATAIEATQKQLSKLSKQSASIDAFTQLKRESQQTAAALEQAKAKTGELSRALTQGQAPLKALKRDYAAVQQEVDGLAQELRNAAEPSEALTLKFKHASERLKHVTKEVKAAEAGQKRLNREFEHSGRTVTQLKTQQQDQAQQLQKLRGVLKSTGISTSKLSEATRHSRQETQRLNEQLKAQQRELEAVAKREQKLASLRDKKNDLLGSAAMDSAKIAAAGYGLQKLSSAYGEVASAQGTIQSLGIGAEGIEAITKAARDFSNQWSGTTQADFIAASYDIKSGIASLSDVAVGEFTRIAAMTAGATKASTEQMTSLFASGYGIYRKQFDQFGAHAVAGWKTLSAAERDMKFGEYFSAGIASSVKAFKTNGSEMSAAISNLGASATSANVSFAEQLSILGQLQATMSGSEAATKYKAFLSSAAGAADDLGLNFLDANNQLKDMPSILTELRNKYGDTIDAVEEQALKKAFGTDEAMALIKLLYPEIDTLKKNIGDMDTALKGGMATTNEMAQAILLGPNESVERMNQRIGNLTATLGKVFAPMIMVVTDKIGEAAVTIADLSERFPFLTQLVGGAVMGLIGLKTILIGVKLAQVAWNVAMITGMQRMTLMSGLQRAIALGAKAWAAAQWVLNAALTANPIGLVVMAVAALIAIVATLVDDWTPVTQFFSDLWGGIQSVFWSAIDGIKSVMAVAWQMLQTYLSFTPLGMVIENWEPLVGFFAGLWDQILGMFQNGMAWITDTLGKVKGWWDSVFGDEKKVSAAVEISRNVQSSAQPTVGGYAGGVATARTGLAASHTMPASYSSNYQVSIQQQPGENGDDVAQRVRQELDRRDREKARRGREGLND